MKVRFKTLSAGPGGSVYPGDVIEVPDEEAMMLIDGGYADAAEANAPRAVQQNIQPAQVESEYHNHDGSVTVPEATATTEGKAVTKAVKPASTNRTSKAKQGPRAKGGKA